MVDILPFDSSGSASLSHPTDSVNGIDATAESASTDGQPLNKTLAKEETDAVRCLRIVVLLVLLAAASFASATVYLYMKDDEEEAFEETFYDSAFRLVEGFHSNAKLRVQVMDVFSVTLTSAAMATDQVWPFVTIRDYDAIATSARSILGSESLAVYPRVTKELRKTWEQYTQLPENLQFVNDSFAYQEEFYNTFNRTTLVTRQSRRLQTEFKMNLQGDDFAVTPYSMSHNITRDGLDGTNPHIWRAGDPENPQDGEWINEPNDAPGSFYPMWLMSPVKEDITLQNVNYNMNDSYALPEAFLNAFSLVQAGDAVFAGVWNVDEEGYIDEDDDFDQRTVPLASLLYPIFDKILVGDGPPKEVVAIVEIDFEFGPFFTSVLPDNSESIVAVVSNCEQVFTYEIIGDRATYLGAEDLHDPSYNDLMVSSPLTDFLDKPGSTVYNGAPVNEEYCPWELHVYATKEMEDVYVTNRPWYFMAVVLAIFFFTCLTFVVYDMLVEKRQKKVMKTAVKSDNIVASLFPKTFRDALYEQESEALSEEKRTSKSSRRRSNEAQGGAFHAESLQFLSPAREKKGSAPMAQLYPNCTVFFADIAGFTAWSSARSPTQVFTLLETLYGAFDKIAKRHKVFKIETIGDCYVAVTGLPAAQPKHALLMVKFASDCLTKMSLLTRKLELTLGPDTGELALRVGLHSGPVTAGVLRGEKARFQLFGDSVNMASRMESNGKKDFIHTSQETADILQSMGKGHWVFPREEKIVAKGKGELQTYWVRPSSTGESVCSGIDSFDCTSESSASEDDDAVDVEEALCGMQGDPTDKMKFAMENYRSISWVVDLLFRELKEIVHERRDGVLQESHNSVWKEMDAADVTVHWSEGLSKAMFSLGNSYWDREEGPGRAIDPKMEDQLRIFVSCLAYSYKDAPFHNFNHACQVLMSADKMLKQVESTLGVEHKLNAWVKFTFLLSAIVGDVDPSNVDGLMARLEDQVSWGAPSSDKRKPGTHVGMEPILEASCSNLDASMMSYDSRASKFHNSLEVAWGLLMDQRLLELRRCLCENENEYDFFCQLLVNLVSGSDVSSFSLAFQREQRWIKAFNGRNKQEQTSSILEHVSLAAQWTHTMQHWTNYMKWTIRFYREVCEDYKVGNISSDPSMDWYSQEILLFQKVIIPLSEKLQQPKVLGAMGIELYKYASHNCKEWAATQQDCVGKFNSGALDAFN